MSEGALACHSSPIGYTAGFKAMTGTGTMEARVFLFRIKRSISRTTLAEKYRSPHRGQTRAGTCSNMKCWPLRRR